MANSMTILRGITALAAIAALSACTAGNGGITPPVKGGVNPGDPAYSNLQLAVGTANIAGSTGLNVVATLRQPNGLSAVGYSIPSLTWDGAFTNTGAPASNPDSGKPQITGAPPAQLGTAQSKTTFGSGGGSWGVFGNGLYPANSDPTGQATQLIVYPCLPVYATGATDPLTVNGSTNNCAQTGTQFIGGPPAFPQTRNGSGLAGQLGSTLGFTPFQGITPAPNATTGSSQFTLAVQVPTGNLNGTETYATVTKTATMRTFAPLSQFATPAFATDGAGGGRFTFTAPAGVSEVYLLLVDEAATGGNCHFGGKEQFFSVHVTSVTPGVPQTVGLGYNNGTDSNGDNLGPTPVIGSFQAGQNNHTICTAADNAAFQTAQNGGTAVSPPPPGDSYYVYAVGTDYPSYAALTSSTQAPALAGPSGQADVTLSAVSPVATSP
jgi:hypothetical protein